MKRRTLISLLAVVFVLTLCSLAASGRQSLLTGSLTGVLLSLVGAVLLSAGFTTSVAPSVSAFVKRHVVGAVFFRIPLMCLLFCLTIFWLKTNALGILIGMLIGGVALGGIGLTKLLSLANQTAKEHG